MRKQSLSLMPKTTIGRWSVWLIVAMILLFIAGMSLTNSLYRSIPAGSTIIEDISFRPALALSMLSGMLAGVSAFVTGLLAIIKKKDQAMLVYISSLIGALLVIFLALEILFPH